MKQTFKGIERQAIDWDKLFGKPMSDKGILCKIQKEILELNNKKKKIKAKYLDTSPKRTYRRQINRNTLKIICH